MPVRKKEIVRVNRCGPIRHHPGKCRLWRNPGDKERGTRAMRSEVQTFEVRREPGKVTAWLRLARLQFYPGPLMAYSVGTASAWHTKGLFDPLVFVLGYACLFVVELTAVLTNEYYDYEGDNINENAGLFNGGSRMIADGFVSRTAVKRAILPVVLLLPILGYMLAGAADRSPAWSIALLLLAGAAMALGYTAPPARLSYRGMGEPTVGLSHSFYMVLCGHIFQGGAWTDPMPWLLSIPLFLATLAAITLAHVPDRAADSAVSKKTIASGPGVRAAGLTAMAAVAAASASGVALFHLGYMPGTAGALIYMTVPHGAVLLVAISRMMRRKEEIRELDTIMGMMLSFIIWFAAIPVLSILLR